MTLLALVVAVTAGAQHHTTVWPYNPDVDANGYYGSNDLLGFLPLYSTQAHNAPEPCDYDGTEWEELYFGLLDGSMVLDSAYFSFTATDISTYSQAGCPFPVTDTVTVSDYIHFSVGNSPNLSGSWSNGNFGNLYFGYDPVYNQYEFRLPTSPFILAYTGDGFFGGGSNLARIREYGLPLDVLAIDSLGVYQNEPPLGYPCYYEGDCSSGNSPSGYQIPDDDVWEGYMYYAGSDWSLLLYYHELE